MRTIGLASTLIIGALVVGCGGGSGGDAGGGGSGGSDAGGDRTGDKPANDSASDQSSETPGGDLPKVDAPMGDTAAGDGPTESGGSGADALPPPGDIQLWYWHHSYLSGTSPIEPAASKALIDKAVAAGYTGLALWDSSLAFLMRPGWDASKLKAVVDYATSKGLAVLPTTAPFGYSNDLLLSDGNLAEGTRVIGSRFKAESGVLVPQNGLAPLPNGGFESGKSAWFGTGDARTDIDTATAHGGTASAVIHGDASASDNARLTSLFDVTPWRTYHVRFWIKTSGFGGNAVMAEVLDFDTGGAARIARYVDVGATMDWKRVDLTFNSREAKKVGLYMGVWGGFSGTVWIDDVSVEETALVNLIRRAGAPLSIQDPSSSMTFAEGTDVAMITDPEVSAHPGTWDDWHEPPLVTIPPGSKIADGQIVAIDHYTAYPAEAGGVGACLTDPAIQEWMHDDLVEIDAIFPKTAGIFLSYDEMRHMDSCASCRAKGLSPGDLLAWHVGETVKTVRSVHAGGDLYFWSDMFDPGHNAHDDYYYVEGDIAGSWKGLPDGAVIMNWNLGGLTKTASWYGGVTPGQPKAYRQIIAGYYDAGGGAARATDELAKVAGIRGIVGVMYTTWADDYTELASYADAARKAWDTYKKSLP